MNPDGDAVYWLYLVSRGHFASLTTEMRGDLVGRGWIEAETTGAPVLTPLGQSIILNNRS